SRTRSARVSRCSEFCTSSSSTGAGSGSRLAMRSTNDIRPKPVSTTCAPCSWAILAAWNAIEASVITPVMSRRLPSSNPDTVVLQSGMGWVTDAESREYGSVPHTEAAVDGQDRTVDVGGLVGDEEPHSVRDLGRVPVAGRRDLLQRLGLLLLTELVGHVADDEAGSHDVRGDVAGPELPGQRPCEPHEPRLARGVVHLPRAAGKT